MIMMIVVFCLRNCILVHASSIWNPDSFRGILNFLLIFLECKSNICQYFITFVRTKAPIATWKKTSRPLLGHNDRLTNEQTDQPINRRTWWGFLWKLHIHPQSLSRCYHHHGYYHKIYHGKQRYSFSKDQTPLALKDPKK